VFKVQGRAWNQLKFLIKHSLVVTGSTDLSVDSFVQM